MIDAPLAFAFAAGLVAAFNPCGFAMLPAYIGTFLGLEDRSDDARSAFLRAARVGMAVSAGFALVFGVAGVLIVQLSIGVQRYAPWLTIVIGIGLVALGIAMLLGRQPSLKIPLPRKMASGTGTASMFVFGVSYALVSMSCTMPIFLAASAGTLERADFISGLAIFGAYGGGMALVLVTITAALALAKRSLVARIRTILPHVNRIAGVLLVVAGTYVAYFGTVELRLEGGFRSAGGPVDWVTRASGWVSRLVTSVGVGTVSLLLIAVVAAVATGVLLQRQRRA